MQSKEVLTSRRRKPDMFRYYQIIGVDQGDARGVEVGIAFCSLDRAMKQRQLLLNHCEDYDWYEIQTIEVEHRNTYMGNHDDLRYSDHE